jgi:hypothetical protein
VRVYLDICCLKRPFDDQRQPRIRMESEAILALLALPAGQIEFVRSKAHDVENDQNPLLWRAARVRDWLASQMAIDTPAEALLTRTRELLPLGFGPFDALHLASAEFAMASVFLTVDDRLISAATRSSALLKVGVREPVGFLRELVAQ